MLNVYVLYIRSVLARSAVVWHSSITKEEQLDLEQIQKCALWINNEEKWAVYKVCLIKVSCKASTLGKYNKQTAL